LPISYLKDHIARLIKEKMMSPEEMKKRTKRFGLEVIRLVESLGNSLTARVVGNQLVRSATSVGANYRAACKARSKAEFIAKLGITEEEADESAYWIEMLIETKLAKQEQTDKLLIEANELTAIIAASRKTAITNRKSSI
jgi:four helix bundle protein